MANQERAKTEDTIIFLIDFVFLNILSCEREIAMYEAFTALSTTYNLLEALGTCCNLNCPRRNKLTIHVHVHINSLTFQCSTQG